MAKNEEEGMRLTLRVDISADGPSSFPCRGALHIEESFSVNARGFIEVCNILGKFHALAESIAKGGAG